jgi:hypothetical protein
VILFVSLFATTAGGQPSTISFVATTGDQFSDDARGTAVARAVVSPAADRPDSASRVQVSKTYGRLPLQFEANEGQTDERVKFLARGPGHAVFLTPTETVLVLTKPSRRGPPGLEHAPNAAGIVLRMAVLGANPGAVITGRKQLPGKVHYFIGNELTRWRSNVRTYARVHYQDIYPGIDLVYYGNERQLEYDFVVRAGANPRSIVLDFEGVQRLEVDAQGDLVLHTAAGEIRQRKPVMYQEAADGRRPVSGGYVLGGTRRAGFQIDDYDTTRPLIIDPVLVYSTYLGGSGSDQGAAIAVDAAGNAYVTGSTQSANFPTAAGAFDTTFNGLPDAFVTKLDPSGSALVYSTYLGGSDSDQGAAISVDGAGNAYVTGFTRSFNFPVIPGAFDTTYNGAGDVFVTKLNPTGSALVYSTYLGGSDTETGLGIATDVAGNAYVTGVTLSLKFPVTPGAFATTSNGGLDAFVTKLNPTGSALVYSTYLGGNGIDRGFAIALDVAGNAYVTGFTGSPNFPVTLGAFDTTYNGGGDVFVTKFNPIGSGLVYSTYLGGLGNDEGRGIAVDGGGNAYVTGGTNSANFPTTPGAFDTTFNGGSFDAFVTKLNPIGSGLVYSTYLGGSGTDQGFAIAVDAAGDAYVTGATNSANFPTTVGAVDTTFNGDSFDAFVTKLAPTGSALVYSTYLGGSGNDQGFGIALDLAGNAYVTGFTTSSDFPTTPGAFDTTFNGLVDAFIVKIADVGPPATLTLDPSAATNPVDSQHCVTATVRDAAGTPVPNVLVHFTVTGSVSASGSATTDANGQAMFCYFGPPLPGADAITAYADTNKNSVQDPGEPSGAATKTWVLPITTPLCDITITNGGWITAANGDRASFGGNAQSSETGETQGQQEYQDHGPAQPLNVHSISVLAIVCEGTMEASIYGQATIDGSGSFFYRIRVTDMGEPGVGTDTYWILLGNGYDSGEQPLEGGNVQILN